MLLGTGPPPYSTLEPDVPEVEAKCRSLVVETKLIQSKARQLGQSGRISLRSGAMHSVSYMFLKQLFSIPHQPNIVIKKHWDISILGKYMWHFDNRADVIIRR